jgi:glycosyltransferase involved in cell wall biosynthesis
MTFPLQVQPKIVTKQLDAFGWQADEFGCGTLRIRMPFEALRNKGYHVGNGGILMKDEKDLPKTLIGQRLCKDGPASLWFHMAVKKERPRMVFELDDDLWNVDASSPIAYEWFLQGYDRESNTYHDVPGNLRRGLSAADAVTCTTEPLAEILGKFNENVHIIPNYLPRWLLDWDRPRTDKLSIGWMGSGTHNMDWDFCGPHIRRFMERNPSIQFRVIGTTDPTQIGFKNTDQVVCDKWFMKVEDCWRAIDFDIAVIPLRPHVFNNSKSHLKFLEFASLGIPVVAANAGPYSNSIKHGETGFLVRQDHEWAKYLRMLANDEAMRLEIGQNAKNWARAHTLEDNIDKWEGVLFG